MKKPFYRLKKFYILVFVLTLLISLSYIFLHRPLGLIIWDKLYYEGEREFIEEIFTLAQNNEEEFKKLYKNKNLHSKLKNNEKELLNYMENFDKDFKIMQIFGLDNLYLEVFKDKTDIFESQMEKDFSYFYFYSNHTNLNEVNDYLNIIHQYNIFLDKIYALPNDYATRKILVISDYFFLNFIPFAYIFDTKLLCSMPQKEELFNNMINSYDKINLLYSEDIKFKELLDKPILRLTDCIELAKGRLNACK